jgi:YebC/PmpR family DNA-binding regulatory protein
MSGHSRWSTIKHKKAAADAKKGKVFSKLAKEIMSAARQGGGDPGSNITLRTILGKARAVNMPADNIERAIKKGTGELAAETLYEMTYEGYAPGGVGLIVQVLTDNKNRTAAEVRHVFTRWQGSLAGAGSVARNFQRKGAIVIPASQAEEDALIEIALEAGADDVRRDGDQFEVVTEPGQLAAVLDALNRRNIPTENSELALVPLTTVPVTDPAQASALLKFIEALEELDDVQHVYANFDIDNALMESLQAQTA